MRNFKFLKVFFPFIGGEHVSEDCLKQYLTDTGISEFKRIGVISEIKEPKTLEEKLKDHVLTCANNPDTIYIEDATVIFKQAFDEAVAKEFAQWNTAGAIISHIKEAFKAVRKELFGEDK